VFFFFFFFFYIGKNCYLIIQNKKGKKGETRTKLVVKTLRRLISGAA
jgi:hypothetical protein